ncbi:hypothetical protein [Streptomyces fulvoviolaceus]|uniref:hypothetical protein n=1 Tax=Streptomyces fulvoviolaceus TaxID=285535 RepID=UPI0005BE455A|nr:hypothetical protein [Streptomyces fulvoviolaceus]MCT9079356.1 hypothetical protein [Streptomyces fulvoviolaceus]
METFVTVVVILVVIALGLFFLHQLKSQGSDTTGSFHYGRSGTPLPGPAPRKPRGHGRTRRHIRKRAV